MDMTDPRLQLSDLTDYQYQTSLAQQYAYTNPNPTNPGYFQSLPQDVSAAPALRSSQRSHSQAHLSPTPNQPQTPDFHVQALYQRTSIPDTARGFNTGSRGPSSANPISSINIGNGRGSISRPTPVRNPGSSTASSVAPQNERTEDLKDPTTFVPPHLLAPMKPNPPSLKQWREKFFDIDEPLLLTSIEYLTYFPHVDNVYSHRSTQKYKRKPFVSHYWDCRLKGRPTGTPMNKNKKSDPMGTEAESEPKKRKRKARERDLCDVKIKVTEYFGTEELEALRKLGLGPESNTNNDNDNDNLSFVLEGHQNQRDSNDATFGVLEPAQHYPPGHPGANGKKWYLVQRVSGNEREGEEILGRDLDHKHTLEESDRIKKNSVQRRMIAEAKEKKKAARTDARPTQNDHDSENDEGVEEPSIEAPRSRLHATGLALQTLHSHAEPTENHLTFYGCSYCPFSQRIWIALELIGVPYRYVQTTEKDSTLSLTSRSGHRTTFPELTDINPEGKTPCLKHNNFAVWESSIIMEYLEDLDVGPSLFSPAGNNPQLKAHSRLWVDFIDRRILPIFYALLLLPDMDLDETQATIPNLAMRDLIPQTPQTINTSNRSNAATTTNTFQTPPHSSNYTYLPNPHQNHCISSSLPPTLIHANYRNPQTALRAHSLIATLHSTITTLVNASHREGPFFLGPTLSYVDIAFAPWIIRLSRVLSYYRGFPRPEVGTRWRAWCDAIEDNDIVKRTISEDANYREVYGGGMGMSGNPATDTTSVDGGSGGGGAGGNAGLGGVHTQGWQYDSQGRVDWVDARTRNVAFPEMRYARRLVETEGWGLGGDVWGKIAGEDGSRGVRR